MATGDDSAERKRRKALSEALLALPASRVPRGAAKREALQRRQRWWLCECGEFLREIGLTAELIAAGRTLRRHAALLEAVERVDGRPAIADVARRLRIPRQEAHRRVTAAAAEGLLELVGNDDDRRIVQVVLSRRARTALESDRAFERGRLIVLFHALEEREVQGARSLLRTLRERLRAENGDARLDRR